MRRTFLTPTLAAVTLLALSGCTSGDDLATTEDITASQDLFAASIEPLSDYLINEIPQAATIPDDAPTRFAALSVDYDVGVSEWLADSTAWNLPDQATDGVPSRGDMDTYNDALEAWASTHEPLIDALIPCAGTFAFTDCLTFDETGAHEAWQEATEDMLAAEKSMIEAANDSR